MKRTTLTLARASCALLMSLSFPYTAHAGSKAAEIDRHFSYYNEQGLFNGVVLAAENGSVIYRKAFGFSDFENKTPLDASAVFSIASITKPYTALAVMMLVERGQLSYEDRLTDYFPEFPSYADPITIRHLLTHTSGLADYLNDLFLLHTLPEVTSQTAVDSLVKQAGLEFEPGEKYEYSNSGYVLLGEIIEKVTGGSYAEFIRDNILEPLGMHSTYIHDESAEGIPGRVKCYRVYWEGTDYDLQLKAPGSGGIYSTADDQFLFDQALYSGRLVRRETLAEAFDPPGYLDSGRPDFKYGFGWNIDTSDSTRQIVYHRGGLAGFRALLWRDVGERNTLIVLANNTWPSRKAEILDGATNIMKGGAFEPSRIPAIESFYENWYLKGFDAGVRALRRAVSDSDSTYEVTEEDINMLGYVFMNRNETACAIEIFRLNVELYPEACNAYDSLGEAYLAAGDGPAGILNYRKALELNPECETAAEALAKIGAK